jgi:hypothetical protein
MELRRLDKVRFTLDEAQAAADGFNFNCGPASACAILGLTPAEIRPHLLDFEAKGYTNPTLMAGILTGLGVRHRQVYRGDTDAAIPTWPNYGLVRIQFAGPWTKPGVPMAARYRATHMIGYRKIGGARAQVFDINAMCAGGWIPVREWEDELIPWLIRECYPKADGEWWPTHCIEVEIPK